MPSSLVQLQCGVNSYAWGKTGNDSCAARYAAATAPPDFTVNPNQPYAELWMGTHPSNPSYDIATRQTLLRLIQDNEDLLSPAITKKFGRQLPFLFKILSIKKALSIQAHPNKTLAKQLHANDPAHYPDENHKPEMAIAITPFEALCGFRPLEEISHFLEKVPPLREVVGEDEASLFRLRVTQWSNETSAAETARKARKETLRRAFSHLMNAPDSLIQSASKSLVELAKSQGVEFADGGVHTTSGATLSELIIRLHKQYGPDHGLFVLFFANFVTLQPGEALYLQADNIHAYVSGDIVECMATSDNVVRAGFTAMYKDVPTLVDMLTYDYAPIDQQKMVPSEYPNAVLNQIAHKTGSSLSFYDPPIEEFAVVRSVLDGKGATATFHPLDGPSVVICTRGKGNITVGSITMEVKEGFIFFVGSNVTCVLESKGDDNDFEFCKAFCTLEGPQ